MPEVTCWPVELDCLLGSADNEGKMRLVAESAYPVVHTVALSARTLGLVS